MATVKTKTKKTKSPTTKSSKTTKKSSKTIEKPVWLKYTEKEVKEIVLAIAKKQPETTAEKIGLILRDSYGIPKTRIYGLSKV